MHPEICKVGPLVIYSYGLMLAVAFLVAVALASQEAKRQGVNPDIIFNLCFVVFISGIIGARIFYVLENLGYYLRSPMEIIMLAHGGLSWFGGLILGVISGVIYLRHKKANLYRIADLIIPFVALAQALGRIGCFLNGCCFGKESAHGIYFPVHQAVLIPTQIYSSFALLLIFVILRFLQAHPHREGQIFYMYLLLYSIKRFLIEFWRADNKVIIFDLTLFQLISAVVFVFSVFKLVSILKNKS
ncbi:MAG: prolipoprotein diacylglyceryl transferase [Candidatus Omnitrophica bacterium CG08_land_8_20_14_0_20_41_16]|uniref:Phosphatidylglycerol--prolipoprotein diacylglyceryl transferase n=1 Tax=Candidatus Sherwoodlollariibacterium unditelluris TaxID=1974757 RepID=A0A2G9YJL1_9BACT|nr:MAG: prolipoprotein diacylglyceryl transferase [Candidatus Omnitrophica bacterium CG23_combo_of_CG06-09_8_20_14_all_41_10]PIS34469.1 MAG: prolipoprotein diacylglyceryl transferase [Candidatus Omnitrophica bacterium CG08_land_8_20_14_0_20_41_16]